MVEKREREEGLAGGGIMWGEWEREGYRWWW